MTAGTSRMGLAAGLFILIASNTGMSAQAAVRTCTARLTSIAAQDETERGAKKKAITDWMVKATAAGITSPTWRLAAERRLICQAVPGTGPDAKPRFECIAVGHACTITQNPAQPPPPAAKGAGGGI